MEPVPAAAPKSVRTFPDYFHFQMAWRRYQARILDRLPEYVGDRRVHLVAAPGSGKTILGLEIIRRIAEPTLVLAPTITIRDQWVDRLTASFLVDRAPALDWVSVDLRNPAILTITTYQALHSLCGPTNQELEAVDENEEASTESTDLKGENSSGPLAWQFPEVIRRAGFRTLVVDEAHHLRSEWWKTLTFLADRLDRPTIVALTATPPYDVMAFEWQRYEELCGPVDAEVSVPELVREGDLCPHQDYVYLSLPGEEELKVFTGFREGVELFVARLVADKAFAEAVNSHPWIISPSDNLAALLDDPEYLSSMVIFLNSAGSRVPRPVVEALGLPLKRIPGLNLEWLEILLTHVLYSDAQNFSAYDQTLKSIRHDLLQLRAIERRRVKLQSPADSLRLLTRSVTKLTSISEIVKLEAAALKDNLRCVVLTDFIRKSELPQSADEPSSFEDIGVVPIFETLRRANVLGVRIGVLSGSLVVIPATAVASIQDAARKMGVHPDDLILSATSHDPEYRVVRLRGEYYQGSVRLITSIFEAGAITVLVGTKSLLGEGWDAPCINTLVLASFVGSYVLSNQMRGRSIRVDPGHPDKTANIWHVVCVEPGAFGPGEDYELLARRCATFVGVSATAPIIENGTDRLDIGRPPFDKARIEACNVQTCARALGRRGLSLQWKAALDAGAVKKMVDGLEASDGSLPRGFVVSNTIAALVVEAIFVFSGVLGELMRLLGRARLPTGQDGLWLIVSLLSIAAIVSLPWAGAAVWRWIRHSTPERSIKHIGEAVLESLQYAGEIGRRAGDFRVYADRRDDGSVFCWIAGGTGREQNIFLEAMRQILRPVESPRFILARHRLWRWFREDYFSVPEALARKKEFAQFFAKQWRRRVGPVQLVFTRTQEGRFLLLRARGHSLAASFQRRAERISCWK